MRIWTCKIGVINDCDLPSGADFPMRIAIENAFTKITWQSEDFLFSGWGGELDDIEMSIVLDEKRKGIEETA